MEPETRDCVVDGMVKLSSARQDWPVSVREEKSIKRSRSGRVLKGKIWHDEKVECSQ